MICPTCKNIYPAHYKECVKCGTKLVKEQFAPQEAEVEEIEEINPFVEMSEIKVGEM